MFESSGNMSSDISNEEVYKRFVDEVSIWGSTGKTPAIASLDLGYAFDLQRKRLENKGVIIDSAYNLRGEHLDNIGNAWTVNDSGKYKSRIVYRHYEKVIKYKVNNKVKHKAKENQVLYLIITRLENQNPDLVCCCPNCAAVSDIKTLLSGCPSCGTKFIMNDLFPKVTNFFTISDYGENKNSIKKAMAKWLGGGAILCAATLNAINTFSVNMISGLEEFILQVVLCSVCGGIIGAIGGYVCWAIAKLLSLFAGAAKSLPYLAPQLTAHKKLPELMATVDKNFSYEYFVGKILALLKTIVFCDNCQNLAVYEGKPFQNTYSDIIDIQYQGAIRLNSFEVKGQYCYVGITVFTTVFRENRGKIKKRNENFTMTVCQNINSLADTDFTLKNVSCKNCGGSFDATKEHNCPYCGTAYHLGDDDWVVLSFT